MIEIIHIIITLFAALVVTILGLFLNITFFELSKQLLIIIPIFFIIGLIYKKYMIRFLELDKKASQEEDKEKNTEGEQAEASEGQEDIVTDEDSAPNQESDYTENADIFDDFENLIP